MLQICSNIKQARKSTDYTQHQLAEFLGVSRSTYANWENNTEPELTTLKSIAQVLNIGLGELIDSEISEATKNQKILALEKAVKVLTHELVQIKSIVTKESQTKIALEIEKLMQ